MSDAGVSGAEFSRAVANLRDDMREGFRGINARFDVLNGQTRKHGESLAVVRHDVDSLTGRDDAQDVAIEAISNGFARIEAMVKSVTKEATTEAVSERVPSKKAMAGYSSVAATAAVALIEIARAVVAALKG